MTFLTLGFPVEAIAPVANSVIGVATSAARPMLGLGVFATFLVVFRPLLAGLLRAGLMLISPRARTAEQEERARARDAARVARLARSLEAQHPGLAAELRAMACSGY